MVSIEEEEYRTESHRVFERQRYRVEKSGARQLQQYRKRVPNPRRKKGKLTGQQTHNIIMWKMGEEKGIRPNDKGGADLENVIGEQITKLEIKIIKINHETGRLGINIRRNQLDLANEDPKLYFWVILNPIDEEYYDRYDIRQSNNPYNWCLDKGDNRTVNIDIDVISKYFVCRYKLIDDRLERIR